MRSKTKGWDRAARVTVDLGKKGRDAELIIHFKGRREIR